MGECMIRHVQEFSSVEMLSASAPAPPSPLQHCWLPEKQLLLEAFAAVSIVLW